MNDYNRGSNVTKMVKELKLGSIELRRKMKR